MSYLFNRNGRAAIKRETDGGWHRNRPGAAEQKSCAVARLYVAKCSPQCALRRSMGRNMNPRVGIGGPNHGRYGVPAARSGHVQRYKSQSRRRAKMVLQACAPHARYLGFCERPVAIAFVESGR
jgi:hypothetical protein